MSTDRDKQHKSKNQQVETLEKYSNKATKLVIVRKEEKYTLEKKNIEID